jgi:DNA transposition AAA+ family ATPase
MNDQRPNERDAIDQLADQARVIGPTRVIADGAAVDTVTTDQGEAVIDAVNTYLSDAGMSRGALARSLGTAATTLGSVLNKRWPGTWRQRVIDLDLWLEKQLRQDAAPRPSSFVWTRVAQEIRTVAQVATTLKTIGLVFGPETSGMGKTLALRAIAAETPGSVIVTVEKLGSTAGALCAAIARALRVGSAVWCHPSLERIKHELAGTSRLLMIDQVHNLCDRRDDRALYMLADLFDATGAPQLWRGTTDVVGYLNRGQAKGRETLAQIRGRIGIARDLMERTRGGDGGGPGEPLYTADEVRAVFARNKMRLTPDATRYLMALANLPDSGALRTCVNLVAMATTINEHTGAAALTADMLRSAHRLLVSRQTFTVVEQRMADELPSVSARVARAG